MPKRYLHIWFPYLPTDRMSKNHPELSNKAFLLHLPQHGRVVVHAVNQDLAKEGIQAGMVLADVRAIFPDIESFPADPEADKQLLNKLAEWCFRFSPIVASSPPDGLTLDISGCPHLWGGELAYLNSLTSRLQKGGYQVCAAIADTIGAAWACARYGHTPIIQEGKQQEALSSLPPAALRLDDSNLQRLNKLGFREIGQLIHIPRTSLRRRFGDKLLVRLGQALGTERELLKPIKTTPIYLDRLPCMEPIRTVKGIEIAIQHLLDMLCSRLANETKGLRAATLKGYRLDGQTVQISIGTNQPSRNTAHLFKLFELKINELEPDLGIELFTMEATLVEDLSEVQEALWSLSNNNQAAIAELLDNIAGKVGQGCIRRYLPQESYWPERSIKAVNSLDEQPKIEWPTGRARPIQLLTCPEPITALVQTPDYPPVQFTYKGEIIPIVKADGPERIEPEWWHQTGLPRDYYQLEDKHGVRYWIFRLGLHGHAESKWFLHGYFV